jgi:hypothetical protein
MEVEPHNLTVERDRPTQLRKVDLYGSHQTGKRTFDHRKEAEPVGNFLPQLRVESVNFWWQKTDNQNVALQGLYVRYQRLHQEGFFTSFEAVDEKIKNSEKDYETIYFDPGEYLKQINLTTASANGKVGAIEFVTTYNDRRTASYGSGTSRLDEGKNTEPLPPGETKNFNFLKAEGENFPGYVVGFYGQYDENHITHLGVYVASFVEINYYARRPYIFTYKKFQQDKNLVNEVAKKLNIEREGDRFKDADFQDKDNNSSKVLFYFLEASSNHPELFKAVLEYL